MQEKFEKDITENSINCLLFDGRREDTRVMLEMEGGSKSFPGLIKEEPGGSYLFQFVPEEAIDRKKIIADHLVD